MAKTKRLKAQSLPDRWAFFTVCDRIADLDTQLRVLAARRDRAVQRIQAKYAEHMEPYAAQLKADLSLAEKFAEEHRDELLPAKRKSADTGLSTYGFRKGNPAVRQLSKWTVAAVVQALKDKHLTRFIRIEETIAKDVILAEHVDGTILGPVLSGEEKGVIVPLNTVGLKIEQTETFYVEARVEGEPATPAERKAL